MTTLQDVLANRYEATTLSQMLVVTRIQELAKEGADLTEQMHAIHARMAVIQTLCKEFASLLADMPDENVPAGSAQDFDLVTYGPVDVEG